MPRAGVIIHVSPSAIEVGLCAGGRLKRSERVELDPADWAESWSRQLRPLDSALSQLIQKTGVRHGARVDTIYQSPETRVELLTVQARGRDALSAARLSLSQGAGDRTDRTTIARALASETVGGSVRTHVLCAGDTDVALDSVARWLDRAGLVPRNIVPGEAVEALDLAQRFAARTAMDASLMLVGEHRTLIVSGEGPNLRCIRTLDFGFGAMIDAMARAARAGDLKHLSPGALRDWARAAIFRVGIPKRDQAVDESANVRAEHVLPLLQPILQRYAVEVKQTVRFAQGEAGLIRGSLLLLGGGAAIPSLAPVLSTQIDIPVSCDGHGACTTTDIAAASDLAPLSILPFSERRRRDGVSFKRAVLVGAGAAAVLIAADAANAFRAQYQVRSATDAQMMKLIEVRRDIDLRQRAAELATRVQAMESAAATCLGARPDWAALMDELGALGTDQVRLTDVNIGTSGTNHVATISGVAVMPERGSGGPDPLAAYIERLQRSPMIDGVELGSTRLGEFEGAPVKHFMITARLVTMPPRLAGARETP